VSYKASLGSQLLLERTVKQNMKATQSQEQQTMPTAEVKKNSIFLLP